MSPTPPTPPTPSTPRTPPAPDNPLLATTGLPRFDLIRPEHVVPAVRQVLREAEERLQELEHTLRPTWEGLLEPLEALDLPFEYAWGPVTHLLGVKNSDALRKAHQEVQPEVVAFSLRAKQSRPIYEGLLALRQGPQWPGFSPARQRLIELKLREARHAGVGLSGAVQQRFSEVERERAKLGTDFSNNLLDATKAFALTVTRKEDVAGWPASLKQLSAQSFNQHRKEDSGQPPATAEEGPWRITLDGPSYLPFMQHCRNRHLREQLYRAHISRASAEPWDNTPLLTRLIRLRGEKARLLGFRSFAELSLEEKMAGQVSAVERIFTELRQAAWPHAQEDFRKMAELARQRGQLDPLAHWDTAFWSERLREVCFDYTEEQLRPYFPLPRVLEGLFSLSQRLFGIRIEQVSEGIPVWHPEVRYYRVRDESGQEIAGFYLDPYSRPSEKRGGAWMDSCLGRRLVAGQPRHPVAHLTCNGTPPVEGRPSLMSFSEVVTLFHEFGHGLQHMLTRVEIADLAGISGVEWDAVEIASQFMENWCYHRATTLGMTAHVESGQPLPDDLFEKLRSARTYQSGWQMMRQLQLGMLDLELYHRYDPDGPLTPFDVHRQVAAQTAVLQPLPEDRFLCGFQHIFPGGYAAGYYSYKWSEVLSADVFAAFEEAGLDDEQALARLGRHYRETILGLGGSRPPLEVFRSFRGREPSTAPLLRHHGLLDPVR